MLTMYPALVGHSHLLPHLTFLITPESVLLFPCFTAKQLEPQEGCVIGQGHTAHGITFVSEGTFTRGKHEGVGEGFQGASNALYLSLSYMGVFCLLRPSEFNED